MLKVQCDVCGAKIRDDDNHWCIEINLDFFGEIEGADEEDELGVDIAGSHFHICEKCYEQVRSHDTGINVVDEIEGACSARTHKVALLVKTLTVLGLMVIKKEHQD